jgi:hypothetical protein
VYHDANVSSGRMLSHARFGGVRNYLYCTPICGVGMARSLAGQSKCPTRRSKRHRMSGQGHRLQTRGQEEARADTSMPWTVSGVGEFSRLQVPKCARIHAQFDAGEKGGHGIFLERGNGHVLNEGVRARSTTRSSRIFCCSAQGFHCQRVVSYPLPVPFLSSSLLASL